MVEVLSIGGRSCGVFFPDSCLTREPQYVDTTGKSYHPVLTFQYLIFHRYIKIFSTCTHIQLVLLLQCRHAFYKYEVSSPPDICTDTNCYQCLASLASAHRSVLRVIR